MKVGFLTSCFREGISFEDMAKWAGESGFETLELRCARQGAGEFIRGCSIDPAQLTPERAEELKGLLAASRLEISCLTYCVQMLSADEAERRANHDQLQRTIEAAAARGVGVVSCFAGRDPEKDLDDNVRLFAEVFQDLVALARDKEVKLALENCPMVGWPREGLPGNIAYAPPIWRRLFDLYPDLGLNYDPSHLVWQQIDHVEAVIEFRENIQHVHAKDTEVFDGRLTDAGILLPSSGWWRYRLPGMGEIDWGELISTLLEHGYDGPLSIEHEDPVWSGDAEKTKKGLLLGRRHLRGFLI